VRERRHDRLSIMEIRLKFGRRPKQEYRLGVTAGVPGMISSGQVLRLGPWLAFRPREDSGAMPSAQSPAVIVVVADMTLMQSINLEVVLERTPLPASELRLPSMDSFSYHSLL